MSESWEKLCKSFTPEKLLYLIRNSASNFRPRRQSLDIYIKDNEIFDKADQIGVIEIPDERTVIVGVVRVRKELTFRTGKRKQYDLAKDILKNENHNAGILLTMMMPAAFVFISNFLICWHKNCIVPSDDIPFS